MKNRQEAKRRKKRGPVKVDFETRSKADLKAVAGRKYSLHPTTQVICAVLEAGGVRELWLPGDPVPKLAKLAVKRGACAHNGISFDRHIWANTLGWPAPAHWHDTAQYARLAGYPKASLDFLGKTLLGIDKDKEASKLTKSLSKCYPLTTRRKNKETGEWYKHPHAMAGQWRLDPIPEDVLERVIRYCQLDVKILSGIWPLLKEYSCLDREVREVDRIVIDRGIGFDAELAESLIDASLWFADREQRAAGVDAALCRSVPKFLAELRKALGELASCAVNAKKPTLEALLDMRGVSPYARALIDARIGTNTIAAGKLAAGLRKQIKGRLHDELKYAGARTWRWTGEGMQLQNLTK
jgi:hypothetical protein